MNHLIIARDALNAQSEAVKVLSNRIGDEFQRAVEVILNCAGRVVICGIGKSGLIGKKLSATLASTGTPSFFLHPAEAFHGDLGMLKPSDVLILISYSGETEEINRLLPSIEAFGNTTISLVGCLDSTLGKRADISLDVSVEREVCPNNLAPTTSTLATMAMGDALAVALISARNFRPMDFARFHPGGSLGRKLLTRVCDVMQRPLPVVSQHASFHDCLLAMNEGRLGMAIVMDGEVLKGVVSDGDMRRAILNGPSFQHAQVQDFMTYNPHTVMANAKLAEAEAYMYKHKIRALVVLHEVTKQPIGIVEIYGEKRDV